MFTPQTYLAFWPVHGEASYGRFHVELISEEPGAGFTIRTLTVTNRQQVGPAPGMVLGLPLRSALRALVPPEEPEVAKQGSQVNGDPAQS